METTLPGQFLLSKFIRASTFAFIFPFSSVALKFCPFQGGKVKSATCNSLTLSALMTGSDLPPSSLANPLVRSQFSDLQLCSNFSWFSKIHQNEINWGHWTWRPQKKPQPCPLGGENTGIPPRVRSQANIINIPEFLILWLGNAPLVFPCALRSVINVCPTLSTQE